MRSVFFSRADNIGVMNIAGSNPASLNFKFRLAQLPVTNDDGEEEENESNVNELISQVYHGAESDRLFYTTVFKKQWQGYLSFTKHQVVYRSEFPVSGGKERAAGHGLGSQSLAMFDYFLC